MTQETTNKGNKMTEVAIRDNGTAAAISALAEGKQTVFSSITGTDFASKMDVLNAVTNSLPLSDHLGSPIQVKNIVVQLIEMENEETKQMEEVPRTILVDADGNAYHAISKGLFKSVENIIGILGQPSTWPSPVGVIATQEGTGNRKYFTLSAA